jgi:hypothetical protein
VPGDGLPETDFAQVDATDASDCCEACQDTAGCAAMYYQEASGDCELVFSPCGTTAFYYQESELVDPGQGDAVQSGGGDIVYDGIYAPPS